MYFECKAPYPRSLRLPHSSRFFVVQLLIFCRGQRGIKFVGTSACRTLADFLSRLTSFQLRSSPCWKRRLFTWLSWQFLIGWGTREPRQIVLVHRTLADKARQGPTRCFEILHCQISSDKLRSCRRLVWIHRTLADKWRFFRRPTKNRLVCGGL